MSSFASKTVLLGLFAVAAVGCVGDGPKDVFGDPNPTGQLKATIEGRSISSPGDLIDYPNLRILKMSTYTRGGPLLILVRDDFTGKVGLVEVSPASAADMWLDLMRRNIGQKDPFKYLENKIEAGEDHLLIRDEGGVSFAKKHRVEYLQDRDGKVSFPGDTTLQGPTKKVTIETFKVDLTDNRSWELTRPVKQDFLVHRTPQHSETQVAELRRKEAEAEYTHSLLASASEGLKRDNARLEAWESRTRKEVLGPIIEKANFLLRDSGQILADAKGVVASNELQNMKADYEALEARMKTAQEGHDKTVAAVTDLKKRLHISGDRTYPILLAKGSALERVDKVKRELDSMLADARAKVPTIDLTFSSHEELDDVVAFRLENARQTLFDKNLMYNAAKDQSNSIRATELEKELTALKTEIAEWEKIQVKIGDYKAAKSVVASYDQLLDLIKTSRKEADNLERTEKELNAFRARLPSVGPIVKKEPSVLDTEMAPVPHDESSGSTDQSGEREQIVTPSGVAPTTSTDSPPAQDAVPAGGSPKKNPRRRPGTIRHTHHPRRRAGWRETTCVPLCS